MGSITVAIKVRTDLTVHRCAVPASCGELTLLNVGFNVTEKLLHRSSVRQQKAHNFFAVITVSQGGAPCHRSLNSSQVGYDK